MATTQRGTGQAESKAGGEGGGGLLGPIFRALFGGGSGEQRQTARAPVLLKLPPHEARETLERILRELRPSEQQFRGYRQTQISDLLMKLNEESDKFIHLTSILVKPFMTMDSLIIDYRTARIEIKSRMASLAVSCQIVFENYIAKIYEDVESAIAKMEIEGTFDPSVIDKVVEAYRLLLNLLGGLLHAIQKLRIMLYLNMPAEQRSPILNQLLGFDIVRT